MAQRMTIQLTPAAAVVGLGVLVLGFVAWKGGAAVDALGKGAAAAVDGVAGVLTGNNAITKNASNSAGEKVTAYEGAGILGTLGAGANAISGGWFATLGENVGGWIYETANPEPVKPEGYW